MKIIDLLNKIANGEEVPSKIKYRNIKFLYDKDNKLYTANEYNDLLMELSNHKGTDLNYEVEILKEEKKIPEKLEEFGLIQYNLDYIDYKNIETLKEWLNKDFQTIYDTLDLLVKNQNKLIDYLKSKGDK